MEHMYSSGREMFQFLLLGKTGSGKSTTGNTILGQDMFSYGAAFSSVTDECQKKSAIAHGATIEIMDSPGLFDTAKSEEEVSRIVVQSVAAMYPGPDAIFYVIKIGRYTEEEFGVYNRLKALLDENVTRYMIIIFTHGDHLKDAGDFNSMLSSSPQTLRQVLSDCSHRYIVFDNTVSGRRTSSQVAHLLQNVRTLKAGNGNQPYRCPKYAFVAESFEEELSKRLQKVEEKELEHKKYVQELSTKLDEAELAVVKEKEEFDRKDREMQEAMKQKEKAMNEQVNNLAEILKQQQVSEAEQRKQTQELRDKVDRENKELFRQMKQERRAQQEAMAKKDQERIDMMHRLLEEREREHRRSEERHMQEMALLREQIANAPRGGDDSSCTIL